MTLQKLGDVGWREVRERWRADEEKSVRWRRYWETRGFVSWEEWRDATHKNLRAPELSWSLWKVDDPLNDVPRWRGGMFHAWATWFYPVLAEQPPRLGDLMAHPGVHNHWLIQQMAHDFPAATQVIGIRTAEGDVTIVEGMHRCCAIALAAHDSLPLDTDLTVALADWPAAELPRLGSGWQEQ